MADRLYKILKQLQDFEVKVTQNSKDEFISSVRQFFCSIFQVKDSFWISVPVMEISRPPLLACREEVANQGVHLLPVIKIMDECAKQLVKEEAYEIWEMGNGKKLILLTFSGPDGWNQHLLLPNVNLIDDEFLTIFQPIVQRRWSLSLEVQEVQSVIFKDSLTGLYNQRFLEITLNQKIIEQQRYNTPFTILFIDVDHFKKVNDSSGHLVGSAVLKQVGALLGQSLRGSDFAFRYGGDEFIALLSHTQMDSAHVVAERLRKEIEKREFFVGKDVVGVTVSIGLAEYPKNAKSAEEIIEMADKAMYHGKNSGRNTVYKAS